MHVSKHSMWQGVKFWSLSPTQPRVLCSFNTWTFLHHRIKIQQPTSFFYLQTITNHKITDPHITRNKFFLCKDKRTNHVQADRSHTTRLTERACVEHMWAEHMWLIGARSDGTRLTVSSAQNAHALRRQIKRERKSMCFFILKHMCLV